MKTRMILSMFLLLWPDLWLAAMSGRRFMHLTISK